MKWQVDMKVKDYIRNWSDQEIHTEYKGVTANIKIKDNNCKLELEGEENVKIVFQLLWELLFLYDGYFYEPISYEIDGVKWNVKSLLHYHFINRQNVVLFRIIRESTKRPVIRSVRKYDKFRNTGISDKK